MWRKKGEGLYQECSTKDKKEGTVGRTTKFMVAISHGRGVIECFPYEGNINGELFSQFVRDRFSNFFSKRNNWKGKLFLQDKDPSQNCKISQEAMNKIPYRLFMIPPQSPDLNPIKNIFYLAGIFLTKDAIMKKIKRETYKQFCNSVLTHFITFHQMLQIKQLHPMPKLIGPVIKKKVQREHHWRMVIISDKVQENAEPLFFNSFSFVQYSCLGMFDCNE